MNSLELFMSLNGFKISILHYKEYLTLITLQKIRIISMLFQTHKDNLRIHPNSYKAVLLNNSQKL